MSVCFSQLLSAAGMFQLGVLQRHCELICSQHINLDNAVSIYKTAKVTHPFLVNEQHPRLIKLSNNHILHSSTSKQDRLLLHCAPPSFFSPQAHGSEELSSFCEGYFLQQMPSLLEKESFKSLLLGPPCSRHGNGTTSTLAHSRGDSAVEELEATLARRLRSLHVTSRV